MNKPDITLDKKGNLTDILGDHATEPSPMRGFDPQFQDIVDYIVKITHEIWEERGVGRLYDYYGTNMRIHTSGGEIFGRDAVIAGTIQTLAGYPDRRLYAEEVIWTGNDDDGYFSSHRLRHTGTNWGHTPYGAPTGKSINYRAIADCAVVEGVIVEEWLVRDELCLVHQLGFDVHAMARKMAGNVPIDEQFTVPSEPDRLRGQMPPVPPADSAEFDIELFVRNAIHDVWNWRLLNKIRDYYVEGYVCDGASGRKLHGLNAYTTYVLSLLAPFPDLAVTVDHFCALQEDAQTYRTATRWTMAGTHTGHGIYGQPTGKRIQIMGVTHHHVKNGKFIKEFTLFDEFALLKQIYAP